LGGSSVTLSRERNDNINKKLAKKNLANVSRRETTSNSDNSDRQYQSRELLDETDIDNALQEYDIISSDEETE